MRFVDTNVLVYAVSPASEDADKRRKARDLLSDGELALSVQVIQEFYVQVTRPSRSDPLTSRQALAFLASTAMGGARPHYRARAGREARRP